MGDIVKGSESANTFKHFFVCRLIADAVSGGGPLLRGDMRTIKRLVTRLDGAAPKDAEMENYQTRLGDVLNIILDFDDNSQLEILPVDTPLMAIGKTIAYIALLDMNLLKTPDAKNSKDMAVGMILDRCGGRKTTPLKGEIEKVFVEPEWLSENEKAQED